MEYTTTPLRKNGSHALPTTLFVVIAAVIIWALTYWQKLPDLCIVIAIAVLMIETLLGYFAREATKKGADGLLVAALIVLLLGVIAMIAFSMGWMSVVGVLVVALVAYFVPHVI